MKEEYVALLMAMKELILMMNLLKEMSVVIRVKFEKPTIKSKLFEQEFPNVDCAIYEDNQSCIALSKCLHMNSTMKHIALKYYHFRRYIEKKIESTGGSSFHDLDVSRKPLSPLRGGSPFQKIRNNSSNFKILRKLEFIILPKCLLLSQISSNLMSKKLSISYNDYNIFYFNIIFLHVKCLLFVCVCFVFFSPVKIYLNLNFCLSFIDIHFEVIFVYGT